MMMMPQHAATPTPWLRQPPVTRTERLLAVGYGVDAWSAHLQQTRGSSQFTTMVWPRPLLVPNCIALPSDVAGYDEVYVHFPNLAVPGAQWPALIGDLLAVTAPGGWIEIIDAGILPAETPSSVLNYIEALTKLYADALYIDLGMPERCATVLAQTPGIVPGSSTTTTYHAPLGRGSDPRGEHLAALWLSLRTLLFPAFRQLALLSGDERRAAALLRDATHASRALRQQAWWPLTITRARTLPASSPRHGLDQSAWW